MIDHEGFFNKICHDRTSGSPAKARPRAAGARSPHANPGQWPAPCILSSASLLFRGDVKFLTKVSAVRFPLALISFGPFDGFLFWHDLDSFATDSLKRFKAHRLRRE